MKIAVNTKIDYKPKQGDLTAFKSLAVDFKNVDISSAELARHIQLGHSFCAQHVDKRQSTNFTAAGFIAVDIDNGMTLADALAHEWVNRYAAIVYTTWSHSDTTNRFRIVFELDRDIEDANQMKCAYQGLIRKFGGDTTCKDACRLFYGAKDSSLYVIGKILPTAMLDELIKLGEIKNLSAEKGDDSTSQSSARRSCQSLNQGHLVKTARGAIEQVSHLEKKTSVHCPFHIDKSASAFIVESRNQIKGVHCSKCNETFWPETLKLSHLQDFDFYGIDGMLNEMEYEEDPTNWYSEEDPPALGEGNERIIRSGNGARLTNIEMTEGIILVRSPKGTGKSFQLNQLVEQCKENGLSVLLIGHRQSLISALANGLGLACYLDKEDEWGEKMSVANYYAICLDSIPRMLDLKRHKFEVIIIDESEQVFSHLTADTLKKQRRECFLKLERYIKQARTVVACDADLSYLTIDVISRARNGECPTRIYVNRNKQLARSIALYKNYNHLIAELVTTVNCGGRHYVCCNSKKKADEIAQLLRDSVTREIKIQLITKDNSQDPQIREFIKNIRTRILDFDIIVSSPSLGTGIDISFADDAQLVDGVFGFFDTRINTHFDIDQQLSRVRNPAFVKAWISPEKYSFEIEPDVIKQDLTDAGIFTEFLIRYDENNEAIYPDDESLMSLHAEVIALSRASKNNLKKHFIDLKKYNGWTVDEIEVEVDLAEKGSNATKKAKDYIKCAESDELCSAEKINRRQAQLFQKQTSQSRVVHFKLKRYWIENFYEQEISPDLIDLDDAGKFRAKVRLLATFIGGDDYSIKMDASQQHLFTVDKVHFNSRKLLIEKILSSAKLLDQEKNFNFETKIHNEDLQEFIKTCREYKSDIENILHISLRNDLHNKPISQLGVIIRMMGLDWKRPVKNDIKGKRIIYYSLDEFKYKLAEKYAIKCVERGIAGTPEHTELGVNDDKAKLMKGKKARKSP